MLDITSVRNLGLVPVSTAQPAGQNPRDGASFAALQAQVDRLTDLHSGLAIEWPIVARLAGTILKDEGKDLAAGTWLALALFRQSGLPGLADGIHVLRDLVESWWQDMSPPATRLRGRRNQMQWLLDQLTDALNESVIVEMPAISAAQHADMLADWDALDTAWQAHDVEAPAFYGLAAVLRRLPVQNENPAEPGTAALAGAQAGTAAAGETTPAPAGGLASSNTVAAPDARTGSGSTTVSAPPAVTVPGVPEAGADVADTVQAGLASLHPLIAWLVQQHPATPMLFRLNRICAWAALEQCPPAQGRSTRLPSPGQVLDAYEQVIAAGDPEAVIRFAEARLVSQPYWLDLNRVSHAALTQLKAHDAAQVLAQETAHFMARMPGLAELTFNDGRAFADPATQAWLDALQAADAGSRSADEHDAVAALAREAEGVAVAGRLTDALVQLQSAVRGADSGRTGFRLRLAQCHLIHRFDAKTDVRPLIAPLIEELEARRLASWEPELARQALELAAGIELRHKAHGNPPAVPMLGRLSRVDVNAAWQLSQSTAD